MKKVLLLLTVLCGISISSFAQSSKEGGKFSIGLDAGLPVGELKDGFNFAIGGSLKYDHPVAENLFITGSAGFERFLYKSQIKDALKAGGLNKSGESYIPVKVGAKYFLANNFYGEAQLGVAFYAETHGGTGFAYAPGIGYAFGGGLDIGVRYEAWSFQHGTIGQFATRLAYSF